MPSETLHDFKSKNPGFVSEWAEHATTTDGTAAEATRDGEAGKTHFVCGMTASGHQNSMSAGAQIKVQLKDEDGTVLIEVEAIQGGEYGSPNNNYPHVWTWDFSAPIQIAEGKDITCSADSGSSSHDVHANIWGFTSSIRVN